MLKTNVFDRNLDAMINPTVRLIINYGGSSSSKTISILQLLLLYALKHKNKRIIILSSSLPKVKKTVLKDFQKVVLPQDNLENFNIKYFNKTDLIYNLPNGSEIQFISADAEEKIIGMRMDILYVDEVNHVKKSVYDQLSIRTKEKILVSYNPSSKFYIMDEFERTDSLVIHSTYKDNPYVDERIIKELFEKGSKNKNFKRVYLEGKPGILEGLIFEEDVNYEIVKDRPHIIHNGEKVYKKHKQIVYGLDFGFNDPTCMCKIILYEDKKIYIEEIFYKTKLTPDGIVEELRKCNVGRNQIIADSARPELIEYIYKKNFNIHSVKKTTILEGINNLLDYYMLVDEKSEHFIEELNNYGWDKDKYDNSLDKPIDKWNHCGDCIRYGMTKINKGGGKIEAILI